MPFQACRHWAERLRDLRHKRNLHLPVGSRIQLKEPPAPRTRIRTPPRRIRRAVMATRSSQIPAHRRREARATRTPRHKHTAEGRSSEWLARARKKLFACSTRRITTTSGSLFTIPTVTAEVY